MNVKYMIIKLYFIRKNGKEIPTYVQLPEVYGLIEEAEATRQRWKNDLKYGDKISYIIQAIVID